MFTIRHYLLFSAVICMEKYVTHIFFYRRVVKEKGTAGLSRRGFKNELAVETGKYIRSVDHQNLNYLIHLSASQQKIQSLDHHAGH